MDRHRRDGSITTKARGRLPIESGKGSVNHNALERIGQFNNLALRLAAHLVSADGAGIDRKISEGLRLSGEFLGLDQMAVVLIPENGERVRTVHSHHTPGGDPIIVYNEDNTPWLLERVRNGEMLKLSNLPSGLPEEARVDGRYYEGTDVRSCFAFPFKVTGSIQGALILSALHESCQRFDEFRESFRSLSEIFAHALRRQFEAQAGVELRTLESFLEEVSTKYINLPIEEIDEEVTKDLRRLTEILDVDRCGFHPIDPREQGGYPTFMRQDTPTLGRIYERVKRQWPLEGGARSMADLHKEGSDCFKDYQYIKAKWARGEITRVNYLDEPTEDARNSKATLTALRTKAIFSVPVSLSGRIVGCISLSNDRSPRTWPDTLIPRVRFFGEVLINALERKRSAEAEREAYAQIKRLKEQVEADYSYLREEIEQEHRFRDIIGASWPMKQALRKVGKIAPVDSTVLLLGETGTGKGLIARAIHEASGRKERPLVQVNCAALTASLIESELFGHERGAFTGAITRRVGRFEFAHGGTLFLDEIGDLPPELQAKLLRVLQDGELERVGGNATIKTNARVIAATNKDLAREVEEGRFRSDLWYRLNIFPITLPPFEAGWRISRSLYNSLHASMESAWGKSFKPCHSIR